MQTRVFLALAGLGLAALLMSFGSHATTVFSPGFDSPTDMQAASKVRPQESAGKWYDGTNDEQSWTPEVTGGNPGGRARANSTIEQSAGLFQVLTGVGSLSGTYQLGFDLNNLNRLGGQNTLEIAVWGFTSGSDFSFELDQPLSGQELSDQIAYDSRLLGDTVGWETQSPFAFTLIPGFDKLVIAWAYDNVETGNNSDELAIDNVTFVPEPGTAILLLVVCTVTARRRRRDLSMSIDRGRSDVVASGSCSIVSLGFVFTTMVTSSRSTSNWLASATGTTNT